MHMSIRKTRKIWGAAAAGLLTLLAGLLLSIDIGHAADKGGDRPGPMMSDFLQPPGKEPAATPVAIGPWTGFYVGGHLGYGVGVNELSSVEGGGSIRGLSTDGALGGIHAGVDWQMPGTIWVLGARGGYTWSGSEFSAGPFSVGITDSWWIDGRIGLGAGQVLPYVFAGYTEAKIGVHGVDGSVPDLHGWRAGTGIEWKLPGAPFVTLGLDYAYTKYDDVKVEYLRIEPEEHRVLATLNFRFGGK